MTLSPNFSNQNQVSPASTLDTSHVDRIALSQTRSAVLGLAIVLVAQAGTATAAALSAKALIDRSLTSSQPAPLPFENTIAELAQIGPVLLFGGALVFFSALSLFLNWLGNRMATGISQTTSEFVRTDLLDRLLTLKSGFYSTITEAELLSRLGRDVALFATSLRSRSLVAFRSVPNVIFFLAALIVVLMTDQHFPFLPTLTMSIAVLALALAGRMLARASSSRRQKTRHSATRFEHELQTTLKDLSLIKSMSLEASVSESLRKRLQRLSLADTASQSTQDWVTSGFSGLQNLLRAIVFVFGTQAVVSGELSLGSLAFFLVALEALAAPVRDLVRHHSNRAKYSHAKERIEDLYHRVGGFEETEGAQSSMSLPFPDAGTLRFEKVTALAENNASFLRGFDAAFEPGDLIALVAQQPARALAFADLLNRIVEPTEGRISIGRSELKRFRLKTLRSTVTIARSRGHFLSSSVRENLLLATEPETDLDDQHVNEALGSAAAVEMVGLLPQKLDTILGEGGYELNPEQSQRLELARAFIRSESRIFFFEDPTSRVDAEDAEKIMESISELTDKGAIVFVMSNRAAIAAVADQVLFLPERGQPRLDMHEALLESNDSYRKSLGLVSRTIERTRSKPSKKGPSVGSDHENLLPPLVR